MRRLLFLLARKGAVALVGSIFALSSFFVAPTARAASLSSLTVGPTTGVFTVGSTFNVSIFLNTAGESINAVDIHLLFPPDKLQVVSPSAGRSIIEIWTAQPSYDNQAGRLHFQGGIPSPGINTESGIISTITFRVKSTGNAVIRFGDESKVFLNDGLGTNVLGRTTPAIYELALPPPAGPIVVSPSHPDQARWYNSASAILEWAHDEEVQGYSYAINDTPIDLPDDISEGTQSEVIYRNLSSGIHYFHIKALRGGSWGGVTHFALNIDVTPPAGFPIELVPGTRTTRKNVVISFVTTDRDSGVNHYEIKISRLTQVEGEGAIGAQPFFIEATSPFVTTLELSTYEVAIRAYDNAGNFTEAKTRLEVIRPFLESIPGEGLRVGELFVLPWLWVIVVALMILSALGYGASRVWRWHSRLQAQLLEGALKDPVIAKRLEQLREKQREYKKNLLVLFAIAGSLMAGIYTAEAQSTALPPPIITVVSERISTEDLFYVGGKSDVDGSAVVVYFQNIQTSETFTKEVQVTERGDWFYAASDTLPAGRYSIWTQTKVGESFSPPSPQNEMVVTRTAIQLGASRVSYESMYFVLALLFGLISFGLVAFIAYHFMHGTRKERVLRMEIAEAERALNDDFERLELDIEAELAAHRKNRNKDGAHLAKEEKLLADLELIRAHIGKEVADIEDAL